MVVDIRQLTPHDVPLMDALLRTFGEAFNDVETYTANRPSEGYLRRLLGGDSFIALAAVKRGVVVGGLAAYELKNSNRSAAKSTSTISLWRQSIGEKALRRP